jgi:hypothetical protein
VPELTNSNFGQVIRHDQGHRRARARGRCLEALFKHDFEAARGRVQRLQNGPPVAYP